MAISVFPITESFAAEVGDIDLGGALSPEDVEAVKRASGGLRKGTRAVR